ncbi:hypothetical protein BOSE29B_110737 [Bosea sp. 29B]|nr:hypothetical protein BOSE29B_110737 [Bosea sp. 29B]
MSDSSENRVNGSKNCSEKQTERTELAVIAQLAGAVEPFQTFRAREKTRLRRFGSFQP